MSGKDGLPLNAQATVIVRVCNKCLSASASATVARWPSTSASRCLRQIRVHVAPVHLHPYTFLHSSLRQTTAIHAVHALTSHSVRQPFSAVTCRVTIDNRQPAQPTAAPIARHSGTPNPNNWGRAGGDKDTMHSLNQHQPARRATDPRPQASPADSQNPNSTPPTPGSSPASFTAQPLPAATHPAPPVGQRQPPPAPCVPRVKGPPVAPQQGHATSGPHGGPAGVPAGAPVQGLTHIW